MQMMKQQLHFSLTSPIGEDITTEFAVVLDSAAVDQLPLFQSFMDADIRRFCRVFIAYGDDAEEFENLLDDCIVANNVAVSFPTVAVNTLDQIMPILHPWIDYPEFSIIHITRDKQNVLELDKHMEEWFAQIEIESRPRSDS